MRDPDPFITFDPVPSASTRHDGWTPLKQRAFIHALAQTGIVSRAARSVGMSPKSAYALLKRAGPDSHFAQIFYKAAALGRTLRYQAAKNAPGRKFHQVRYLRAAPASRAAALARRGG